MKSDQFNPYTKEIKNCLENLESSTVNSENKTYQFLVNMIQGRFLQYLSSRLCDLYEIESPYLEKKVMICLTNLLSQKFFAVFREKIKKTPEIIQSIALKITSFESSSHKFQQQRIDQLYLSICKKYFFHEDFETLIKWIESSLEFQKIHLLAKAKKQITNPACIQAFFHIVQQDQEGITPYIFNRYLDKGKIERLMNLVETGDWKIEADFIHKRINKNY